MRQISRTFTVSFYSHSIVCTTCSRIFNRFQFYGTKNSLITPISIINYLMKFSFNIILLIFYIFTTIYIKENVKLSTINNIIFCLTFKIYIYIRISCNKGLQIILYCSSSILRNSKNNHIWIASIRLKGNTPIIYLKTAHFDNNITSLERLSSNSVFRFLIRNTTMRSFIFANLFLAKIVNSIFKLRFNFFFYIFIICNINLRFKNFFDLQ